MSKSSDAEKIGFFKVGTYKFELEGLALLKPAPHPLPLSMVLRYPTEAGVHYSESKYTPDSGVGSEGGSGEGESDQLSHHTIQVS